MPALRAEAISLAIAALVLVTLNVVANEALGAEEAAVEQAGRRHVCELRRATAALRRETAERDRYDISRAHRVLACPRDWRPAAEPVDLERLEQLAAHRLELAEREKYTFLVWCHE